jgi:hypothetical protein
MVDLTGVVVYSSGVLKKMYEYYLLLLCREEEFTPFEPLVRVRG